MWSASRPAQPQKRIESWTAEANLPPKKCPCWRYSTFNSLKSIARRFTLICCIYLKWSTTRVKTLIFVLCYRIWEVQSTCMSMISLYTGYSMCPSMYAKNQKSSGEKYTILYIYVEYRMVLIVILVSRNSRKYSPDQFHYCIGNLSTVETMSTDVTLLFNLKKKHLTRLSF